MLYLPFFDTEQITNAYNTPKSIFISMDDVNINEVHLFRMKHTKTVSQNDDYKNEVDLKCALLSLVLLTFH